jgi:cold shock CspA family protein
VKGSHCMAGGVVSHWRPVMAEHRGRIKRYNAERGYGFITSAKRGDVFVHVSQLRKAGSADDTGEVVGIDVMFDIGPGKDPTLRPVAINLEKVGW